MSASPRAETGCSALRERVPTRIPQPGSADVGGAGKPPPPRLPRRISARRPRKPKPGRIKKLRLLILLLGLGLLAIVSTFFGMMMAISQDLPQLENKKEFAEAKNSVVLDDQGNKIGTLLNNNNRILVDSGDISPYMKQAAVAIEDKRFYEHGGVDLQGMVRAGLQDILPGGSTQGASTITEQFVKNALEAQGSRTVFQKFREAALAYQLERHWDKDKILTEYLNTIYFGEGAYGIEAAARTYFGWSHSELRRRQRPRPMCAKVLTPPRGGDARRDHRLAVGLLAPQPIRRPRWTGATWCSEDAGPGRHRPGGVQRPDQGINTPLPAASEIAAPDRRLRSPPTSPPGCASRSSTSTAPAAPSAAG